MAAHITSNRDLNRVAHMNDRNQHLFAAAFQSLGRGLAFIGFLTFFTCLAQLIVPLFMVQIYDRVITSGSRDTLLMLLLVSGAGLALFGVLEFIRTRIYFVLGERLARRLSIAVLQAAMTEVLTRSGGNPGQAMRDLTEIRQFLASNAMSVPFEVLYAPLFLIVLFMLHPIYGVVAVVAAAILILLSLAMELVARRPLAEANEASLGALAETGAALRNAEVIEAMGMLPAIARRWQATQDRLLRSLDAGNRRAKSVAAISKSVRPMLQLTMLAVGAVLIIDRQASPGSMVAASIIMGRMLLPFDHLIDGWRQWVNVRAAHGRIRDLLGRMEERRAGPDVHDAAGRLVVDRVSFIPPGSDRPVLRNVSFSLEPGEALGIIGPSAAGKSTLARLLVGVWQPTQGSVYLDGQNVMNWDRPAFGRRVGYLPQSVSLIEGTVRENIARMDEAEPRSVIDAARNADVHEMIGAFPHGYETRVGDSGFTLSGGQKQRVALARALFGDPVLLVLDEPNANLDQVGEQALVQSLAAAKEAGATIVLVTHRPSIVGVCNKLMVLKDGAVAQYGPRAEVLRGVTVASAATKERREAATSNVARLVKS